MKSIYIYLDIFIGFPKLALENRVLKNSELCSKLTRICESGRINFFVYFCRIISLFTLNSRILFAERFSIPVHAIFSYTIQRQRTSKPAAQKNLNYKLRSRVVPRSLFFCEKSTKSTS